MAKKITFILALIVVATAGVLHGRMTDRWKYSPMLAESADRLQIIITEPTLGESNRILAKHLRREAHAVSRPHLTRRRGDELAGRASHPPSGREPQRSGAGTAPNTARWSGPGSSHSLATARQRGLDILSVLTNLARQPTPRLAITIP